MRRLGSSKRKNALAVLEELYRTGSCLSQTDMYACSHPEDSIVSSEDRKRGRHLFQRTFKYLYSNGFVRKSQCTRHPYSNAYRFGRRENVYFISDKGIDYYLKESGLR